MGSKRRRERLRREMDQGKGEEGEVAEGEEAMEEGGDRRRGKKREDDRFLFIRGEEMGEVVVRNEEFVERGKGEGERDRRSRRGGEVRGKFRDAVEEVIQEKGKAGIKGTLEEKRREGFTKKGVERNEC